MRQERKTKRKQTSYVTLFSLKDKAALFPFVRGVMQYCTTNYHPRPKCGRNIHRYINIKVSPIQTFLPIYSHIFFSLSFFCFCTHTTACDPCVCKDVRFVLVYASVCVCLELCVKVFCHNHMHLRCKTTCLSNPTGMRLFRERLGCGLGGGAVKEQDGEIYSNGR